MRTHIGRAFALSLAMLSGIATSGPAAEGDKSGTSIFAPKSKTPAESAATKKPAVAEEQPAPSRTARPAARVDAAKMVDRLEVQVPAGGDLATAYDNYFRQHVVRPSVIAQKVSALAAAGKRDPKRYEESIALIEAALRNGQSQPWMYEALALAMELAKRPPADVERALLSAADFSTNPDRMMYLARYMIRFGLDKRALALFRQASALAPTQTEPYEYALELARRLKDAEGIEWSSLGILRQAWPQEKVRVQEKARYSALVLVEKYRAEGKSKEADRLSSAIARAMRRDVRVRVYWQGEADVDLMVEEPSGTVCSLRNRRTTSGGVLVGKSASNANQTGIAESCEEYVCPEGFNGTYKMLARIVWGKIPSGKVSLEVITMDASGTQLISRNHVDVDDRGTLIDFKVVNGRRQQSLELHQAAVDAQQQFAINRTVLAQQLASLNNPKAIRAQQIAAQAQVPFVTGFTPFVGRGGAVGFQPQLTTLPSGATMSATAVISADRRYVRITALPFFSQIGPVTTFSVAQGTAADPTIPQGGNQGGVGGQFGGGGGIGGQFGGGGGLGGQFGR